MRKLFSCADMREALKNHTLMFNTKFFADLGIKNPDDVANRYADESKKPFKIFWHPSETPNNKFKLIRTNRTA